MRNCPKTATSWSLTITQKEQLLKRWNEDKPTILSSYLFKMNFITIRIYKKSVRWLLLLANPPNYHCFFKFSKVFSLLFEKHLWKGKLIPWNWKSILIEFQCNRYKSTNLLKNTHEKRGEKYFVKKNVLQQQI